MRKRRRSSLDHQGGHELNVWPAVTDTILLMASIFIVLSVVSMLSLKRKIDEQLGAGTGTKERLLYQSFPVKTDDLFKIGGAEFKKPQEAAANLEQRLGQVAQALPHIVSSASEEKEWAGQFYVVLEVAGHTDIKPFPLKRHGKEVDGNWDLSSDRANTVIHEIERILQRRNDLRKGLQIADVSSEAIAPVQSTVLRAAGYSSHLPRLPYPLNDSEHERVASENRRVELRLFAQPTWLVQQPRRAP